MATLHKFKLLATQCAAATSPTRSPTASPIIHLRRRKTLRMLLTRHGSGSGRRLPPRCDRRSPDRAHKSGEGISREIGGGEELLVGHKLKDLFVSSPPALGGGAPEISREISVPTGGGRPLSATLRQRLLRRAWRPALVGIPE